MSKEELDKEIREFIIKVGSMGGGFLGEHGMVHEPTIKDLIEEFKLLASKTERRKDEKHKKDYWVKCPTCGVETKEKFWVTYFSNEEVLYQCLKCKEIFSSEELWKAFKQRSKNRKEGR